MTKENDLVHSFMHAEMDGEIIEGNFSGLTKLEYFSAMAMQGYLGGASGPMDDGDDDAKLVAFMSVKYAKALIKELNKSQK